MSRRTSQGFCALRPPSAGSSCSGQRRISRNLRTVTSAMVSPWPESYPLPHPLAQLFQHEAVFERREVGALRGRDARAVAALEVLEVHDVVALLLHLREHLARVARMDAIVTQCRPEENLRILLVLRHVLVRRVLRDELPVLRIVRIAVLAHPRGAREKLVVASHVEERDLADHGLEEVGTLRDGGADEKSALASAHDADVAR